MEFDPRERARIFRTLPNMRGTFRRDETTGALIAEGAVIVGDVSLARDVSVWFGCVLRGDDEPIEVGEATNIQDGTVVHVDIGFPTRIGSGVTIGHKAMVHGTVIGDFALVGMGAILLTGSVIGERSIVAAGSVVREGMQIPPRMLAAGVPARLRRPLTERELADMDWRAAHYVERARTYL
jgi:carbonic anhydrase/acetyltransferase-like protein (isoleucine patch superfamily)